MQSEMDVLVLEDFVLHKARAAARPARLGASSGWRRRRSRTSPWADPATGDPLVVTVGCARNPVTGTSYPVEDGIPRLFVPTDGGPPAPT